MLPDGYEEWPDIDKDLWTMRTRWLAVARPNQLPPPGDWWVWLLLAGRGFGKTRTAAEDMSYNALAHPGWRMCVCAPTFSDVRDTCFEGDSGILSVLPDKYIVKWNRSMGECILTNGALIKGIAGEQPDRLRGPQFHRTWIDELAAMERQDEVWSNVTMCTRLGALDSPPTDPQIIVTTTPKPTKLIRSLVKRSKRPDPAELQANMEAEGKNDPTAMIPKGARSLNEGAARYSDMGRFL